MKYLILITFLFSSFCFANFVKQSDLDASISDCSTPLKVFTKGNKNRIALPENFNCETFSYLDTDVDDHTKPKYSKSEIESCTDESNCKDILKDKVCSDQEEIAYINELNTEVYCSKLTGYHKMTVKAYREDPVKKAAYDAELVNKSVTESNEKTGISLIKNKIKNNEDLTQDDLRKVLKFLIKEI